MHLVMEAVRIETVVQPDGHLTVSGLPFAPGETVEVIVLPRLTSGVTTRIYSLRGTPVVLNDPTEPVAVDDWTVIR